MIPLLILCFLILDFTNKIFKVGTNPAIMSW